ncbi:MAG: proprotein convertase P-domain-containing protein [Anaerolineae bacterium]|jgi:MYXO-CTERM domain-containing protein
MKQRRSRIIVGVGVLCFVGVLAVWLASSGDRAIAEAEKAPAITKSITQEGDRPLTLEGRTVSQVVFAETEGVVRQLSIFLDIKTEDTGKVKVFLTSPSGTRVLLVDGAKGELKGRFGAEGKPTVESLAAFTGEPITGTWKLTVDAKTKGQLKTWSLDANLGANTTMASSATNTEYGGDGGCDCRVGSTGTAGGAAAMLLLLGLVAIRRR